MFWTTAAYAMGTQGAQGAEANPLMSFVPIILMFAIFYFLLIRPQQKRAKEHRAMLSALKRGDKVVTSGGLHGTIVESNDDTVVLDLGDTRVTVGRGFIAGVAAGSRPVVEKTKKNKGQEDGGK